MMAMTWIGPIRLAPKRNRRADLAPDSAFELTGAGADTPKEHSPDALAARLDAAEALLNHNAAVRRAQVDAKLNRIRNPLGD